MKVETHIITSIAVRPMDELWKLMSVETFKTDYCFYWLHHNAFEVTLTDDCQYQSQSDDTENVVCQDQKKNTDNVTRQDQKKNVEIIGKIHYFCEISVFVFTFIITVIEIIDPFTIIGILY
jgi:hypothetical protein